MKKKKRKSEYINLKPIVQTRGVISVENLPYPIVHYPDCYGHFIAFQQEKKPAFIFLLMYKKCTRKLL
jgi:hypothetical protein